jgi:pimeloyl-ACP methyl ester carboxylesterase
VLDAYELQAAHLVGVSAGGAIAQLVALDHPSRVLSLVVISTSPAHAIGRELAPPTDELSEFFSAPLDWSDAESVIDYRVRYTLMLAGGQRSIEAAAVRALVRREVERARDFSAARNHEHLRDDDRERGPLSSIGAATLVIHGTADPMFPIDHGRALADVIPNADLIPVERAGRGLESMDTGLVANAILEHTR